MRLNLDNFDSRYGDEQSCINYLIEQRWPDGRVCCLYCGSLSLYRLKRRYSYQCKDCHHQFSPKTGFPFERSKIPLRKWLKVLFLMTSRKHSVSSVQIADDLGITQKTAWNIMHDLRDFMYPDDTPRKGDWEVDETYDHPDASKRSSALLKNRKRGKYGGEVIFGLLHRQSGEVRVFHVKSSGARVLLPIIEKHIPKGSRIFSDEHGSYRRLTKLGYRHETTNHSKGERVIGDNNTQALESKWTHLKKIIRATYMHASPEHMQKYCSEYAFRRTANASSLNHQQKMDKWFGNCVSDMASGRYIR